jgi:hypothetical protein
MVVFFIHLLFIAQNFCALDFCKFIEIPPKMHASDCSKTSTGIMSYEFGLGSLDKVRQTPTQAPNIQSQDVQHPIVEVSRMWTFLTFKSAS